MAEKFDAFISYSHVGDKALAEALQRGLHRFAKPIYRPRAIHVFRDESTLALTPALWPAIQKAVENSRYFILLAHPLAAASHWVQKEIACWLYLGRARQLMIVWTGGELVWDAGASDFDWTRTDALPRQLSGAFGEEPLYLDMRWAKTNEQLTLAHQQFGRAVAQLAAPIRGMNLDEMFGEDVRQYRRNRLIAGLGIAAVVLMTMFAGWRWLLELEARQTAQTRLAQTLHERGLVESEEHDRQPAPFLLASQAAAAAPNRDVRRAIYRLRALYLALNEPQAVHQLGHRINWAMMPTGNDWLTFSRLPSLDVWDTRQWKRIRQIDLDPNKLPVTGVSPYVVYGDGRIVEIVTHEAVDQENTRGFGWNNFQQWDLETGTLRASEREVSFKSYKDWIGIGLPSRNEVSVDEVAQLRRQKPDFDSVFAELARQPLDPLKAKRYFIVFNSQPPPPADSSKSWWIDAIEGSGEFIVATYYTKDVPWRGTWNGAIEPPRSDEDVTAVWQWDGTAYQNRWTLKERWIDQFPRSAGFGRSDGRVLLWVLRSNGTLIIADAATGKAVRPPISVANKAWVQLADQPHELSIIDDTGRVSIRDTYWDDGIVAKASLRGRLDLSRVLIDGNRFALTATGYSPADTRGEIVMWRLPELRPEWKWPEPGRAADFRSEKAFDLAISATGRRFAALLSVGWRPELWVWDRARTQNPLLRRQFPEVRNVPPKAVCSEPGALQFRGDDEVVWCEPRQVNEYRTVRHSQGASSVPAEPVWTAKRAALLDQSQVMTDLGAGIAPEDMFLAFSADGMAFLTRNFETGSLRLWPTKPEDGAYPALETDNRERDFADLITVVFRIGRKWQVEGGHLSGRWPNGLNVIVTGDKIEFRSRSEQWTVRDPRLTPSADNRRWSVGKQQIMAMSRSGRLMATVNIEGLTGQERHGNLIRLWDTATGEPVSQWLWHESEVVEASFSDDGWLWTSTTEGRLRRWPADMADLQGAQWIDAIGEPMSGMRLLAAADVSALREDELSASRRQFSRLLEAARGDLLAQWFSRRVRVAQ